MAKTFSASDQNGDGLMETVTTSVPLVEQALVRLEAAPLDGEALEMMYRHTHTIGRTASMMEWPGLAQLAHGMEGVLADVLDGFARLDPPTLAQLWRTLGAMQALLERLCSVREAARSSSAFDGHETEPSGMVVEATISERTDPAGEPGEPVTALEDAPPRVEQRRRPLWSRGERWSRLAFFQGRRTPARQDRGQERERGAGPRLAPAGGTPGPRPQEQTAERAIALIRSLQQERRTGRLTLRRGSGITAEEGWIQFSDGQITAARAGRHQGAEARNWLSTWCACRYLFEERGSAP